MVSRLRAIHPEAAAPARIGTGSACLGKRVRRHPTPNADASQRPFDFLPRESFELMPRSAPAVAGCRACAHGRRTPARAPRPATPPKWRGPSISTPTGRGECASSRPTGGALAPNSRSAWPVPSKQVRRPAPRLGRQIVAPRLLPAQKNWHRPPAPSKFFSLGKCENDLARRPRQRRPCSRAGQIWRRALSAALNTAFWVGPAPPVSFRTKRKALDASECSPSSTVTLARRPATDVVISPSSRNLRTQSRPVLFDKPFAVTRWCRTVGSLSSMARALLPAHGNGAPDPVRPRMRNVGPMSGHGPILRHSGCRIVRRRSGSQPFAGQTLAPVFPRPARFARPGEVAGRAREGGGCGSSVIVLRKSGTLASSPKKSHAPGRLLQSALGKSNGLARVCQGRACASCLANAAAGR